jgi:hypothetical protein
MPASLSGCLAERLSDSGAAALLIALGAIAVAFTFAVNLARGYPLIAIAARASRASYWRWVRAGRPRGIDAIEREAEAESKTEHHACRVQV